MKGASRVIPSMFALLAMLTVTDMALAQSFRRAMFPHRSVGLCFWDRSKVSNSTPPTTIQHEMDLYNSSHGYTGANRVTMYVDPGDNPTPTPMNNWEDWDAIFAGNEWNPTFWNLVSQYNVIIIKTGYPATQQMSYGFPWTMSNYQAEWRRIVRVMANHPDKFFVITTNYPAATDGHSDRAQQSNLFSTWAKNTLATGNDSFGAFPRNVYVLDWFHWIASSSDGYCDPSYGSESEGLGDHPSNAAVAVVDPRFVREIFDAAHAYEGSPVPVTFSGPPVLRVISGRTTQVEWKTLSEINSYRFYVLRNGVTIDSVNGRGTSLVEQKYSIADSGVTPGTWSYQIKEMDLDGSVHYSETASVLFTGVPEPDILTFALSQNYPNPFNPSTTIRYGLPHRSTVELTVFNPLGQLVATLVREDQEAGYHEVKFSASGGDAAKLSSGVYFYRIQAGDFAQTKKLLLLR